MFQPFGSDHLGVLCFTLGVGVLLILGAKRIRAIPEDRSVRWVWAAGLMAIGFVSWIYSASQGFMALPLQMCDLALFLTACALVSPNRYVAELAFFWGLAGSSQAILTPDLTEGFPSLTWILFFSGHSGVVLGAVYLLVRGSVRLTSGSVPRVWIVSNLYLALVGIVNWRLGTNFAYLARKPEHPSLLDYLGPWPLYLFWAEGIALGLFFLCYGLGRLAERRAASRAS